MNRHDPKHLAWVRRQTCAVPGCAGGEIHAHHVRSAANSGTGLKPPDSCSVPLCVRHHVELHVHGSQTFEIQHNVDLAALADWHAKASGQDMP